MEVIFCTQLDLPLPHSTIYKLNEEEQMNRYYNDYNQSSFKIEKKDGELKYFLKIKEKYIEVSEDVFKVCKSGFDKIRYTYKKEVAQSVIYC